MNVKILIERKYLLVLVSALIVLAGINIAVAQNPSIFGHTWGELECTGCVSGSNIGDGAVTDSKLDTIAWSKLTTVPAGLNDGDQNSETTCNWNGGATVGGTTVTCTGGIVTRIQ